MPAHWILVTTMERSRGQVQLDKEATGCCVPQLADYGAHHWNSSSQGDNYHCEVSVRLDPKSMELHGTDAYTG